MAKRPTSVPDNYDGREQAWIKHQLLEAYLEKLLHIIGLSSKRDQKVEICYVDCFAGPWGDDTEHMQGTSIAISLRTMAKCKHMLQKLGAQVTMRALYIELDPHAYSRLEAHLDCATPAGVSAQCLHGDFLELRQTILDWCGPNAFTFFFVDPKGWTTVGVEKLRPLLKRPRSELLINFMYDFINRTASMAAWQQEIADFLGASLTDVRSLVDQAPSEREARLLGHYREGLKANVPYKKARYLKKSTARNLKLAFINANSNDFFDKAASGLSLHPHLMDDLTAHGVRVEIVPYTSLKDFITSEVDPVLHSVRHEQFEEEHGDEMEELASAAAERYLQDMAILEMQSFIEASGLPRHLTRLIRSFSVEDREGVEDPCINSLSALNDGSLYIGYGFNLLTVFYTVVVDLDDYLANREDFEEYFLNVDLSERSVTLDFFRRCDFEAGLVYRPGLNEFTSVSIDTASLRRQAKYR